ncbi:MAG: AraC family transcriptional regulator [Bacilli bacterium]|nr:AraC family transcriptional regulator [Bacilli bacterium]
MKETTFGSYVDDFLDGSYTVYNYDEDNEVPFLISPQIAGFQKVGPSYWNETKNNLILMVNYTSSGKGLLHLKDEEIVLEEGDLLICSNYYYHALKAIPGQKWEFFFIHMYFNDVVNSFFKNLTHQKYTIIHGFPQSKIEPVIKNLCRLMRKKTLSAKASTSNVLYSFLSDVSLFAHQRPSEPSEGPVSQLISYLENNYSTPISLVKLTKSMHYSKNHLERLFKEKTGQTMREYLYYLRLVKAEELLKNTDMSFTQIAVEVGLSEYRSLYHMIKNTYGVSPEEFRNNPEKFKNKSDNLTVTMDSSDPFTGFLKDGDNER